MSKEFDKNVSIYHLVAHARMNLVRARKHLQEAQFTRDMINLGHFTEEYLVFSRQDEAAARGHKSAARKCLIRAEKLAGARYAKGLVVSVAARDLRGRVFKKWDVYKEHFGTAGNHDRWSL